MAPAAAEKDSQVFLSNLGSSHKSCSSIEEPFEDTIELSSTVRLWNTIMPSIYLFAGCIQCTAPRLPRFRSRKSKKSRKAIKDGSDPSADYPEPPTLFCGKPSLANASSGESFMTDSTNSFSSGMLSCNSLPYFTPSASPINQKPLRAYCLSKEVNIEFPAGGGEVEIQPAEPFYFQSFLNEDDDGKDLQSASDDNDWGYFVDMS
ncbi:expressed unknown protein [Seminavis robusta]|uniref:Uncharacterized protein n=1 Tax=Seminavis robusta TaxID=568900 RepID=A0A9N8HF56_9STRA|nr:expressed unknown protein [Seminavis robusta]|eukprot:Sro333_g119590.1 n/a (205) ;mRNA; r:48416-49030